jgi:hypothetical protein
MLQMAKENREIENFSISLGQSQQLKITRAINADLLGVLASGLCMIHCIVTPFLFIAKTCSASCCDDSPTWWSWLDYVFLLISFFAVWQTSKNASNKWVKYALWFSWVLLLLSILNEKVKLITLPEIIIYLPAIALIALHFYNLKYCQCCKEGLCAPKEIQ